MRKSICYVLMLLFILCLSAAFAEGADIQAGEIVPFGRYEQDNNPDNGPEPIEWIVLDVKEGKALLLSKYGLDQLHEWTHGSNWEDCLQREWLNGEFLSAAFGNAEQTAILLTSVDNSGIQAFSEESAEQETDTEDRIFLLSYHEAFDLYFPDSEDRRCAATAYALANDKNKQINEEGFGIWYLRSPGHSYKGSRRAMVMQGGNFYAGLIDCYLLVRPALWIDLHALVSWACPSCGKENGYDSAFCPWCGAKKPEPEPEPELEILPVPVVCPGCGAVYEPDTEYRFCKSCGTELPKGDAGTAANP